MPGFNPISEDFTGNPLEYETGFGQSYDDFTLDELSASASDVASGTIQLLGLSTDAGSVVLSTSGTLSVLGSASEQGGFFDSFVGSIVLVGSAVDVYVPPGKGSGAIVLSGGMTERIARLPLFLLYTHTGLSRIDNIEQWLSDNTTFVRYIHTGLDRIDNIEIYLKENPVAPVFYPGPQAGTDRIWAIEGHLLEGTGSGG